MPISRCLAHGCHFLSMNRRCVILQLALMRCGHPPLGSVSLGRENGENSLIFLNGQCLCLCVCVSVCQCVRASWRRASRRCHMALLILAASRRPSKFRRCKNKTRCQPDEKNLETWKTERKTHREKRRRRRRRRRNGCCLFWRLSAIAAIAVCLSAWAPPS